MQKVTEVQEQIENEKYPIAQETLLSLNQCHVLYFSGGLGEGGYTLNNWHVHCFSKHIWVVTVRSSLVIFFLLSALPELWWALPWVLHLQ